MIEAIARLLTFRFDWLGLKILLAERIVQTIYTYLENCCSTKVWLLLKHKTFEYKIELTLAVSSLIIILTSYWSKVCVKAKSDLRNFSWHCIHGVDCWLLIAVSVFRCVGCGAAYKIDESKNAKISIPIVYCILRLWSAHKTIINIAIIFKQNTIQAAISMQYHYLRNSFFA